MSEVGILRLDGSDTSSFTASVETSAETAVERNMSKPFVKRARIAAGTPTPRAKLPSHTLPPSAPRRKRGMYRGPPSRKSKFPTFLVLGVCNGVCCLAVVLAIVLITQNHSGPNDDSLDWHNSHSHHAHDADSLASAMQNRTTAALDHHLSYLPEYMARLAALVASLKVNLGTAAGVNTLHSILAADAPEDPLHKAASVDAYVRLLNDTSGFMNAAAVAAALSYGAALVSRDGVQWLPSVSASASLANTRSAGSTGYGRAATATPAAPLSIKAAKELSNEGWVATLRGTLSLEFIADLLKEQLAGAPDAWNMHLLESASSGLLLGGTYAGMDAGVRAFSTAANSTHPVVAAATNAVADMDFINAADAAAPQFATVTVDGAAYRVRAWRVERHGVEWVAVLTAPADDRAGMSTRDVLVVACGGVVLLGVAVGTAAVASRVARAGAVTEEEDDDDGDVENADAVVAVVVEAAPAATADAPLLGADAAQQGTIGTYGAAE